MASSNTQGTQNLKYQETSKSSGVQHSTGYEKNVLDKDLLADILGGLSPQRTREEIEQYAKDILEPILNAEKEASQQRFDTTKLSKEQEIENLAVQLMKGIEQQNAAYNRSVANTETAALSRGMGRSSYTLQNIANQGDRLAKAVQSLTDENARQSAQIQNQITQAAQQNQQTLGRLDTDYAKNLAAKVTELLQAQRDRWDSNYLTAVSGSMGKQTSSDTTSESVSSTVGNKDTITDSSTQSSGGGGRGSSSTNVTIGNKFNSNRGGLANKYKNPNSLLDKASSFLNKHKYGDSLDAITHAG